MEQNSVQMTNAAPQEMQLGMPGEGIFTAQAPQAQPQQQQQPSGSMKFDVQGQGGNMSVDERYISQTMQKMGHNVTGISPDGMTISLQDEQGPYEIDTREALSEMGWETQGVTPLNADYDNVQMDWRMAVNKLPDDDMREAYITAKLKRSGIQEPQLIGSGRDWHVFNPGTNSWIGVTNSPKWDMSDVAEAGIEMPRMLGAGIGGAVGAGAGFFGGGVGAVPGAMMGAAGGGAIGDTLSRGMMAMDQDYRDIAFNQNLGATGGDILKNAAFDAAGAGVIGGAGALAQKSGLTGAIAKGISNFSPASMTSRVGGGITEGAGSALRGGAKLANKPLAQDFGAFMTPGLEGPATVGAVAQLPGMATRGMAKAAGGIHDLFGSKLAKRALHPRNTQRIQSKLSGMKGLSDDLQQVRPGAYGAFDKMPKQAGSRDILGNLGEKVGRRAEEAFGPGMQKRAGSSAFERATAGGANESTARKAASAGYDDMLSRTSAMPDRAGQAGESVGRFVEGMESFGKGVENLARGVYSGGMNVAQGVGRGGQMVGKGMSLGGRGMQRVEPYLYGTKGANMGGRSLSEESRGYQTPNNRRNIGGPEIMWASR